MFSLLQVIATSVIPGNRNADNIDEELVRFPYLLFLNRSIQTTQIKAAILKSFGFGQVGGEILIVHPDYLFSILEKNEYNEYKAKRSERQKRTYRYWHDVFVGARPFVAVKNSGPYDEKDMQRVYLDSTARASKQPNGEYQIRETTSPTTSHSTDSNTSSLLDNILDSMVRRLCDSNLVVSSSLSTTTAPNHHHGIGVDIELNTSINMDMSTSSFIKRNYTEREIDYCLSNAHPQASFCGRWAAKEAVLKAICNLRPELKQTWLKGPGAPLKVKQRSLIFVDRRGESFRFDFSLLVF
jgi:phosphopantetheinyl transferase (holo-ACP synthase)